MHIFIILRYSPNVAERGEQQSFARSLWAQWLEEEMGQGSKFITPVSLQGETDVFLKATKGRILISIASDV